MSDNYNPFVLKGRTILVTGASSGIGRMTTICCSKMGARLIVTGRNQERLDEVSCMLESDDHQVVAADLTQPDQVDHLLERLPVVDGVVLCAGQGTVVPFKMADRKKQDPIFEINYFAPVELLRLLLKKKKLANGASVVFVSSAIVFMAHPRLL